MSIRDRARLQRRALLVVLICAGAGLLRCESDDKAVEVVPSPDAVNQDPACSNSPDAGDSERDGHNPAGMSAVKEEETTPADVQLTNLLQKLGAADGGAWTAQIDGGRILLWLGRNWPEDDDGYLAIVRLEEQPRAFMVSEMEVTPDGRFYMGLNPVGRDADNNIKVLGRSGRVYLFGSVCGDGYLLRVDDRVEQEDGSFPYQNVELRRDSEAEKQTTRSHLYKSIE